MGGTTPLPASALGTLNTDAAFCPTSYQKRPLTILRTLQPAILLAFCYIGAFLTLDNLNYLTSVGFKCFLIHRICIAVHHAHDPSWAVGKPTSF